MALEKLKPFDPRVTHHDATVNGRTYHYMLAEPTGGRPPRATILLVHGFPDLGFAWRNQVPMLAEELSLRVIVPDMLGYGQTDAPVEIAPYGHKSLSADLVALVDSVGVVGDCDGEGEGGGSRVPAEKRRFFVGGHDWGGALVWRMALWHPERLRGVFSVCTPYFPPTSQPFLELSDRIRLLPNFGYQAQFAGDELWRFVQGDEARMRQFLNALLAGKMPGSIGSPKEEEGTPYRPGHFFNTTEGVVLERLDQVRPTGLLSAEEMDFYVAQFMRHGLQGPTNWYRTWRLNYDDEAELVQKNGGQPVRITVPSLMVAADADVALPAALTESMPSFFDSLTKSTVPGSHWVLWMSSGAVNGKIKDFLEPLLAGGAPEKASL